MFLNWRKIDETVWGWLPADSHREHGLFLPEHHQLRIPFFCTISVAWNPIFSRCYLGESWFITIKPLMNHYEIPIFFLGSSWIESEWQLPWNPPFFCMESPPFPTSAQSSQTSSSSAARRTAFQSWTHQKWVLFMMVIHKDYPRKYREYVLYIYNI